MADGINYAKSLAPGMRDQLGAEWGGKNRAIYDEFTFSGQAAGTIVNVGVLRKGEVYLGCEIVNAALGTGVTLQVGDAGNDARYMAAQSASSAGNLIGKDAGAGFGYKAPADTVIFIKTGGGAATGKVQIVWYKAAPN